MIRAAGTGASGVPYVHWDGEKKRWRVEIWRNNIRYRFRRHRTIEAAARVARIQVAILDNDYYEGDLTADQRKRRNARLIVEGRKQLKKILKRNKNKPKPKRSSYNSHYKKL